MSEWDLLEWWAFWARKDWDNWRVVLNADMLFIGLIGVQRERGVN